MKKSGLLGDLKYISYINGQLCLLPEYFKLLQLGQYKSRKSLRADKVENTYDINGCKYNNVPKNALCLYYSQLLYTKLNHSFFPPPPHINNNVYWKRH